MPTSRKSDGDFVTPAIRRLIPLIKFNCINILNPFSFSSAVASNRLGAKFAVNTFASEVRDHLLFEQYMKARGGGWERYGGALNPIIPHATGT